MQGQVEKPDTNITDNRMNLRYDNIVKRFTYKIANMSFAKLYYEMIFID